MLFTVLWPIPGHPVAPSKVMQVALFSMFTHIVLPVMPLPYRSVQILNRIGYHGLRVCWKICRIWRLVLWPCGWWALRVPRLWYVVSLRRQVRWRWSLLWRVRWRWSLLWRVRWRVRWRWSLLWRVRWRIRWQWSLRRRVLWRGLIREFFASYNDWHLGPGFPDVGWCQILYPGHALVHI